MDDDLMARRLRPPSEPPRTTDGNGHSLYPSGGSPWAPDTHLRADVPWDKPADEAWPLTDLPDRQPAAMEPPAAIEPDAAIELPTTSEQSWPVPASAAEPVAAETAEAEAIEAAAAPDLLTTWDASPSPWDEPVAEAPAVDEVSGNGWDEPAFQMPASPEAAPEPEPVAVEPVTAEPVVPTPFAHEPAVAEPVAVESSADATDMTLAGQAPWDRAEPFFIDDDRPPEMLAAYDDMLPPAPALSSVAADPDDAFAPVLLDVSQPAPPPIDWSPAAPAPVPPPDAARFVGPTPPDDLFAPTAPDHEPNKPSDASPPSLFSTAPPAQPVVVRNELAIIDDSTLVRAADAPPPVGPWLEPTNVGAPAADEEDLTPRHPDFEPRTHANGNGAAVVEPVPDPASSLLPAVDQMPAEPDTADLPWALPPLEPSGPPPWAQPEQRIPDAPAQPVVSAPDPNPIAGWALQPTANDPLTTPPGVVARPVAQPQPVAQPAAAPVYVAEAAPALAAVATPLARPQTDQPNLWFLSSEPETLPVGEPAREDDGEPSSLMIAGLTVLMAIVVVGLVIVFLSLLTSLPILP